MSQQITSVEEYDLAKIDEATRLGEPITKRQYPTILGNLNTANQALIVDTTSWLVAVSGKGAQAKLHLQCINHSKDQQVLSIEQLADFLLGGPNRLVFADQEMLNQVRNALKIASRDNKHSPSRAKARDSANIILTCVSLKTSTRVTVLTQALARKLYVPSNIDVDNYDDWVELLCPKLKGDDIASAAFLYDYCRRGVEEIADTGGSLFQNESYAIKASVFRSVKSQFSLFRAMQWSDDTFIAHVDTPDPLLRERHHLTGDVNRMRVVSVEVSPLSGSSSRRRRTTLTIKAEVSTPWRFKNGSDLAMLAEKGRLSKVKTSGTLANVYSEEGKIFASITAVVEGSIPVDTVSKIVQEGDIIHAWVAPFMPYTGRGRDTRGRWAQPAKRDKKAASSQARRAIPLDVVIAGRANTTAP